MDIDININNILSSAFQKSIDIYSRNLNLCKYSFSEKNIHDFRVCIRRLLAVNALIYKLYGDKYCIELKHILKLQLKLFNPLRDIQVQFLRTQQIVYNFPLLYKYLHGLLNQEEKLILPLKEKINTFNLNEMNKLFSLIIENSSLNFEKQELFNLAEIRFTKVIEKHKLVNSEDLKTIHKVRLAYKKFRYTMEILREILGLTDDDMALMKSLQTIMGNIQDNAVYLNNFVAYAEKENLPKNPTEEIKDYIFKKRYELVDEYFANFGIIYEFENKLVVK